MKRGRQDASRLVGRGRELETLVELLAAAREGQGAFVTLSGESGIGKTALAAAFAAEATSHGATVVTGRCFDDEWSRPLTPWVEALSGRLAALRESDDPSLALHAAVVAAAAPELSDGRAGELPPALGPEDSRLRLNEAFRALLAAFTPDRDALVVVLDDLQWADRASLDVLRYVGRSLAGARTLVLALHRDTDLSLRHPLVTTLAEVDRYAGVVRVTLAPLAVDDARALAERIAGRALSDSMSEALWRETAGLPLFVSEVARSLAEGDGADEVPESVRQVVGLRVGRLSPQAADTLRLAAAFSGPFGLAELVELTELPADPLLDVVDELERARLLVSSQPGDRYEFAHALVRKALYDDHTPSRRAQLHRRVAVALERLADRGADVPAAELAGQYHRSRALPGAEAGVVHALAAAEEADRRHAYTEAVAFLETADELAGRGDPGVRSDVLSRLAVAQAKAHDPDSALATAADALAALEDADAPADAVVELLLATTLALDEAGAAEHLLRPLRERGIALLADRRDVRWARLRLAQRPLEDLPAGRFGAARWVGFDPEAIGILRASGDELDYAATLELVDEAAPVVRVGPSTWRRETDALVRRVSDWHEPRAIMRGLAVALRAYVGMAAYEQAGATAERLAKAAARFGSFHGTGIALIDVSWRHFVRGQWQDARDALAAARAHVDRFDAGHRQRQITDLLHDEYPRPDEVDWDEYARRRDHGAASGELPPWLALGVAGMAAHGYARAGDERPARTLVADVIATATSAGPEALNLHAAVGHAALAALALRDETHAQALVTLGRQLLAANVGDYPGTSNQLTVACGSALAGDVSAALEELAAARAWSERIEYRWTLAVIDLAEAEIRSSAGDATAIEPAKRAVEAFRASRGTRWRDVAEKVLAAVPASGPRRYPGGLTRREAEILTHLASGRTSKEIAQELVLSVHTVDRHVANIYKKVGARNRAEATAYAHRSGLT